MSLDVSLEGEPQEVKCRCRECDHEHTRMESETFFSANITHNLGKMAAEAGIYETVWRPEEIGITKAVQLLEPLRTAIELMRKDPKRFQKHNAPNGWGLYEHFLPWLDIYLAACDLNPQANVRVSR